MITSILVMAGLGGVSGLILSISSKYFHVEKDPRISKVLDCLPNANCGGCGYAGCSSLALAIVSGKAKVNACPALKDEDTIKIATVLGVKAESSQKMVATIHCSGGKNCEDKFKYYGLTDCLTLSTVAGGTKGCSYGCLGGGSCVEACSFYAIKMNKDNVPVVDYNQCTGCGICIAICPKKIIQLSSLENDVYVACLSADKGAETKKLCSKGCIGCKICEKKCEQKAITVTNFVAQIDANLCNNCKKCISNCPTGAINSIF